MALKEVKNAPLDGIVVRLSPRSLDGRLISSGARGGPWRGRDAGAGGRHGRRCSEGSPEASSGGDQFQNRFRL